MTKKTLVVGLAIVAAAVFVFRGDSSDTKNPEKTAEPAGETFNNQVWIDAIPVRETDKMSVFAALDEPQLGVFQSASQWEGDYSIFSWEDEGKGKVAIEMMQNGEKHKLKVKVSDKDCGNFELCLTVKGSPRGPQTYYSMRDWVIDPGQHELQDVASAARGLLSTLPNN